MKMDPTRRSDCPAKCFRGRSTAPNPLLKHPKPQYSLRKTEVARRSDWSGACSWSLCCMIPILFANGGLKLFVLPQDSHSFCKRRPWTLRSSAGFWFFLRTEALNSSLCCRILSQLANGGLKIIVQSFRRPQKLLFWAKDSQDLPSCQAKIRIRIRIWSSD